MKRRHWMGLGAVLAMMLSFAIPAAASAATLWVSPSPTVTGNGKGCTEPGFNSVQGAINMAAAGDKVKVCSGTYSEQLTITKSVALKASGTPVIKLPATPVNSTTTCGAAMEAASHTMQDGIEVCGGVTVSASGLAIDAAWPEKTCDDDIYGVFIGGGASLTLSNSRILAAGAQPINGCQGGIGIEVGTTRPSPALTGSATLNNVLVEGYQKNGINIIGSGSKAVLKKVNVTGAGPTAEIGQNGIEIARGAEATINKSSASQNIYSPQTVASTGILIFEDSATPISINSSTFEGDDIGAYYGENGTQTLSVIGSKFVNDTYDGVFFEEGNVILNKDTFKGGEDGIGINQSKGQSSGPTGTGTTDKIEGMSSYAIIGYSDNEPGDKPGSFKITNSKISNNPPGASVQHSVFSESNSLEIITEKDT